MNRTGHYICEQKIILNKDTREVAIEAARQINEERFKDSHKSGEYGFARVICTDVKETNTRKWEVRVLRTDLGPKSTSNMKRIPKFNLTFVKEFVFPGTPYPNLLKVIKDVLHAIENRRNEIVHPQAIERKLKKLMIYLLKADSWPYSKKENSVESVIDVFRQFKDCHLSVENQAMFTQFVSNLSKHLHGRSMTLEEVNLKIVTKANRLPPFGLIVCQKIENLMQVGTEMIISERCTPESVVPLSHFCHASAYLQAQC